MYVLCVLYWQKSCPFHHMYFEELHFENIFYSIQKLFPESIMNGARAHARFES